MPLSLPPPLQLSSLYTHMLAEVRVKKPFSTEKEGSKSERLNTRD